MGGALGRDRSQGGSQGEGESCFQRRQKEMRVLRTVTTAKGAQMLARCEHFNGRVGSGVLFLVLLCLPILINTERSSFAVPGRSCHSGRPCSLPACRGSQQHLCYSGRSKNGTSRWNWVPGIYDEPSRTSLLSLFICVYTACCPVSLHEGFASPSFSHSPPQLNEKLFTFV